MLYAIDYGTSFRLNAKYALRESTTKSQYIDQFIYEYIEAEHNILRLWSRPFVADMSKARRSIAERFVEQFVCQFGFDVHQTNCLGQAINTSLLSSFLPCYMYDY